MNIFFTDARVRDCAVQKKHSLALLIAILAFFITIGSDTMRILQDKIPVADQTTQRKQWTKQQFQQSVTNRHVLRDTVFHGRLLHRISPTITAYSHRIPYLHGNINETYGRVVHPTDGDTCKVNSDDQDRLNKTNGPQVAASSSGGGDDDEDDPYNKKLHNNGCGGDESPTDQNDNDQDDDDHENENGFTGEAVDVFGSDNPDDFPNIVLDDDMDIDKDEVVEVGIVDEIGDEDLMGLWEE